MTDHLEMKRNKTYKCPECEVMFNLNSLRIHYTKLHKKSSRELCVNLFYNGFEPTCKCGCGGKLYFFGVVIGFGSYLKGHHVREYDKNPWNKERGIEAKKKSAKTIRERAAEGNWNFVNGKEPWNKNKRKATDAEYAARITFTDSEEFKIRSKGIIMKARADGKIQYLKGSKSFGWKGGVSPLNAYCRTSSELYKQWIYPCLIKHEFKCNVCGIQNGKLEVHHNKEKFSTILRKIAKEEGWLEKHFLSTKLINPDEETLKLKDKIKFLVAEYHVSNNVSGVALCKSCHMTLHPSYNTKRKIT